MTMKYENSTAKNVYQAVNPWLTVVRLMRMWQTLYRSGWPLSGQSSMSLKHEVLLEKP
jgi:hypothetical protein